jgi:hypothetical protein
LGSSPPPPAGAAPGWEQALNETPMAAAPKAVSRLRRDAPRPESIDIG